MLEPEHILPIVLLCLPGVVRVIGCSKGRLVDSKISGTSGYICLAAILAQSSCSGLFVVCKEGNSKASHSGRFQGFFFFEGLVFFF